MNPERFDELTRLWVMAPSRRVFLLQVGAVFAYGALGQVGIRIPRWLGPEQDRQCFPGFSHREGMPCGSRKNTCGTCKNGKCIPSDSLCLGKDKCSRCDPTTITCKAECAKGLKCCKDGCCDGECTADDGACCPRDKQCGKNKELCCRECEECAADNTCRKPVPPKECPEQTHRLVDGCCVCRTRLCGGQCCDAPCLEGKCCEYCGLDNAVCCDGRKCCRERCVDPAAAEKCCECWEDMPADEAKAILDDPKEGARFWAKYVTENDVRYGQDEKGDARGRNPKALDCSLFVQKAALGKLFMTAYTNKGFRISTLVLDGDCQLKRLKPGEAPRAGDLVAQPRDSGPPGSMHVGIATGVGHRAIAMGGTPQKGSAAELTWGPEGKLPGGDQLRVYRPQKPKKDCPKK